MAFGKIRHTQILGEKGTTWYVEIWQRDYTGSSVECDLQGEGFEITWSGQGGTRKRTFIGSECSINLYIKNDVDENFLYEELLKKGERYHYVRIYKNNINNDGLWWFGWVTPGFDSIQNTPYPYSSRITATDSYGFYTKLKEQQLASEEARNQAAPIITRIKNLATKMQFASQELIDTTLNPNPSTRQWLRTAIDWWRPQDSYQSEDSFDLYGATIGAFTEPLKYDTEGNIDNADKALKYKASDVFDGCLKTFNTVGFLAEGYYNFIQPNNLINNNNGTLNVWTRNSNDFQGSNNSNIDTKLTIDQSNNVILGGSVLTYEPSYESVNVDFILGPTNFYVTPGTDLTSSFVAGSIQLPILSDDVLNLSFHAVHKENFLASQFSYTGSLDNPVIRNSTFLTTATLIISITDGTTIKYLQPPSTSTNNPSTPFVWIASASPLSITIARGYDQQSVSGALNEIYTEGIDYNTPIFNASNTQNIIASDDFGPCLAGTTPGSFGLGLSFRTDINFNAIVSAPGIIGDVSIEMTASNDYSQYGTETLSGFTQYYIVPIADPTPGTESTEGEVIFLSPFGDTEFVETGTGFRYSASQNEITSSESFDLGDLSIGSTAQNKLYSVQHFNSTTNQWEPSLGFQRGNPSTDVPLNINQLLVNEYLSLQVEPLEVLQADIQSNDISPLKMLKYSLNGDSSFKNYSFLGGTFKAQSEIMSGEWYKIDDGEEYVTSSTPVFIGINNPISQTPTNVLDQAVSATSNIIQSDFGIDNIGVIDTAIPSNTSDDKVQIDGTTSAKVYDNQELVLSYPDGSNAIVLKSRSESNKGATQVLLDTFKTGMIYPVGSILRPLKSDLTNVKAENVLDVRTAHYHDANTSETYIPLSGASIASSNTLSSSDYQLMFTVPYNGFVKKILNYNSHTGSKTSILRFYKDGDSSTRIGDALSVSSYTTTFEVDCPSNWTFTKGDIISISREDTSQIQNTSMSIVLQYNTQPPAQPQP